MNEFVNKKHTLWLVLGIITTLAQANGTATMFDPLFPETPFKKVIMRCMKVRSTALMIIDYQGSTRDAELLYDSMVGRVLQLHVAMDNVIKKLDLYTPADIEYLCIIVGYMIEEINQALRNHTDEEKNNIKPLITLIKNELEKALDTI